MAKHLSKQVRTVGRAGRAPYNFVPLPDKAAQGEKWMEPPDQDRYQSGELSGEIECVLTAREPFFVRGMWDTWEDAKRAKDRQQTPEPFRVAGQLRLPGHSFRGMVRAIVEMLSKAPLESGQDVNDHQLFFRAVGATNNPRFGNSYEPHAEAYKTQLGNLGERVKAGYLFVDKLGNWRIQPAKQIGGSTHLKTRMAKMEYWRRRPVRFDIEEGRIRRAVLSQNGQHAGWLVCSGAIPKKASQWVVFEPDRNAKSITIGEADVEAYRESGASQLIEAETFRLGQDKVKKEDFAFGKDPRPVPCFYVDWKDERGKVHYSFGHTPFFRLPYRRTTGEAIPADNRKLPDAWCLVDALFGRVNETGAKAAGRKPAAGRVFFEDGILVQAPANPSAPIPDKVVLGSPKPTTYQHYLVQPSEEVTQLLHWDSGAGVAIRGRKRYWHRPGAWKLIRPAEAGQEKVQTVWKPAAAGHVFRAKIRYENLRPFELGALLYALELPAGCCHQLGMGKPLGLGSFETKIQVTGVSREERYRNLFAAGGADGVHTKLETGGSSSGSTDLHAAREAFRKLFYATTPDVWSDDVLQELRALLQYAQLPPNWANRTRYLEFGKVNGRQVNEYLTNAQGQASKRRPLPPASQVLRAAPGQLPDDPRPPFVKDSTED